MRAPAARAASVEVASRTDLSRHPHWQSAFANQRKDRRYFEILEDTLKDGFEYGYFVVKNESGVACAIQPFFLLDQDLLAGVPRIARAAGAIRRFWPRFLYVPTLMAGCVAGEGHLDIANDGFDGTRLLASNIRALARGLGARLIVLKEFPVEYRARLRSFEEAGFSRIPSMPMTHLNISFASFDDYVDKTLSGKTRRNLKRKFRAADAASIEMTVTASVEPFIDEVYPLYLQVFNRSKMNFEKLTPDFFCDLGRRMPDKAHFFLWRQQGRTVAFALCMVHGEKIWAEYLGLDYAVALDLHLYYYVTRDVINWAIAHGCKSFHSGPLNYDPKRRMGHILDPLDLYIRHTSPTLNWLLKLALPLIGPTRSDGTLRKFPNYKDL